MTAQLMTAAEVAACLRISLGRFYLRRAQLGRDHGFPAPVPGIGLRWRPEAITRWLDRMEVESCSPGMVIERQAAAVNDSQEVLITEAQAEMDRRAAGMRRVG